MLVGSTSVNAMGDNRFAIVPHSGGDTAIIWTDADAMERGYDLIEAGAHLTKPKLVMQLIACVVQSGSLAKTKTFGFLSRSTKVAVMTGTQAGCTGDVDSTDLILVK